MAGGARREREALLLGGSYSTRHSDESLSSLKSSVATPASARKVSEPLSAADAVHGQWQRCRAAQPEITLVLPLTGPYDLRAGAAAANRRAARSRRHNLPAYQSASWPGLPGAAKDWAGRTTVRQSAVPGGWARSPSFPGREAGRSFCARAASPQRGEERITRPPSAANDAGLAGSVRAVSIGPLERVGGDRRDAASYWSSAALVPSGPRGHWVAALPVPRGE